MRAKRAKNKPARSKAAPKKTSPKVADGDAEIGRGLLAQAIEAPDDELAHQVYADWLEERGHPFAQVIRLQRAGKDRAAIPVAQDQPLAVRVAQRIDGERVHPGDKAGARRFLEGFVPHLNAGCVGSINEVFDAEEPFTPRGCIAQAWSVAEALRCWVKTAD